MLSRRSEKRIPADPSGLGTYESAPRREMEQRIVELSNAANKTNRNLPFPPPLSQFHSSWRLRIVCFQAGKCDSVSLVGVYLFLKVVGGDTIWGNDSPPPCTTRDRLNPAPRIKTAVFSALPQSCLSKGCKETITLTKDQVSFL